MNRFEGFVRPTYSGFLAMVRFAEDGQAEPMLGPGGKPIVFPTEREAWQAVAERLCSYMNGNLVRWGSIAQSSHNEADDVFKNFVRQKGSGRRTIVEQSRKLR